MKVLLGLKQSLYRLSPSCPGLVLVLSLSGSCLLPFLSLSCPCIGKVFLFFHQKKAEKCELSVQMYRQSAHTEGQKEMLFLGLKMGGFS